MPEKPLGAPQTDVPPQTLGVFSLVPTPLRETPSGEPTSTGLQIKGWQKCDSTSVPAPDGPSRHVQNPCQRGGLPPASPTKATTRASPARNRMPPHPQRARPGSTSDRGVCRAPASQGWRTQTSANKRVVCKRCGNFGENGEPGSRRSAASPLQQVETRRAAHPPGAAIPAPAPGSADFSAGAQLARSPGCVLTSLMPATGATLSTPRSHPTQSEKNAEKSQQHKKNFFFLNLKGKPSTHAIGLPPAGGWGAYEGISARDRLPGSRRPARGRLLCAAGRSGHGPLAVAAGARQVVRAARCASAARTLSCRRRALCTERLPGRRKSTCHFLNCLQLVPLTGPGQAARARRTRRRRRPTAAACRWVRSCAGGVAGPGAWRGGGSSGRVCSARNRRWAESGGFAARRRRG